MARAPSGRAPIRWSFFSVSIQTLLDDRRWDRAESLASLYEDYSRSHPFAEASHVTERARVLIAFGRGERSDELGTDQHEWPNWISPDGWALYFTRSAEGRAYDLYYAVRGQ